MTLEQLVLDSARRTPEAVAVRGPDGALSYRELDGLANQLGGALLELHVTRGERVGLWLEKSTRTVAAMQAALRIGAVYVPLDPSNPVRRIEQILRDCQIRVVVTTRERAAQLATLEGPAIHALCVDGPGGALGWDAVVQQPATPLPPLKASEDDLAYILYTSGSTGVPKGVCISHRNAWAFVEWAANELELTASDRLSNHAPFYFDLSVFDLYAAFLRGASVSLVPETLAFAPRQLVEFAVREQITVWYSVPSALILMMTQGGLLEAPELRWRVLLFAGEPFPIKFLRQLRERLPQPRFLNLYGPTETNVCTFYEVKGQIPESADGIPIGIACSGDRAWIDAPDETGVGELLVDGPTVMLGYWGKPPQGGKPYGTGDLVRQAPDGNYLYLGRRDNMVKVRGRRIELGEIEAALMKCPGVEEGVVVVAGAGVEARLVAFATTRGPLSLLDVKRHLALHVPRYMIVDVLQTVEALPRTRNGKVDRRMLASQLETSSTKEQ